MYASEKLFSDLPSTFLGVEGVFARHAKPRHEGGILAGRPTADHKRRWRQFRGQFHDSHVQYLREDLEDPSAKAPLVESLVPDLVTDEQNDTIVL